MSSHGVCSGVPAYRGGLVIEPSGNSHFHSTTTRDQPWVQRNISCNPHGIMQVPLDLIQNILQRGELTVRLTLLGG